MNMIRGYFAADDVHFLFGGNLPKEITDCLPHLSD